MKTDDIVIKPEDLDPSLFNDPVSLLQSLKQATQIPFSANICNEDLFFYEESNESQLITPVGVAKKYDFPVDFVRSLIISNDIKPVGYVPVFSIPEIEAFYESHDFSNPPIVDAFLYELDHMRTFFSYKPVLLLAVLNKANENGEVSLSDIVDFYLDYYAKRKRLGQEIEKSDSSFVKNFNDRSAAKKTITTYPLKIYCDKGFLTFSSSTNTIAVNPELWDYLKSLEDTDNIANRCRAILDEYYRYV